MDTKLHEITPLEREQRLYERVVDKILALIQGDTWGPGDRLPPERDLAEAFGVSRTVVREAIKVLEARGVLATLAGSGVYVREPDSSTVSLSLRLYLQLLDQDDIDLRLTEIRSVLEVEIAALAAMRATPQEKQEMHRICREMRTYVGMPRVLAEMDFRLHLLLAEATRNELFGVLLTPLMEQLRDLFIYAWAHFGDRPVEQVFDQHETIVDAIDRCDPDAARAAMAYHIAYYSDILLARVQERRAEAAEKDDAQPLPGQRGNGAGHVAQRRLR